jgi:hypothetical protein
MGPWDVSVFPVSIARAAAGVAVTVALENGTGAEGGEVEVLVAESARSAVGVDACLAELERYVNSAVAPEFRLDAALAMAARGPFLVGLDRRGHARVLPPAAPAAGGLAA